MGIPIQDGGQLSERLQSLLHLQGRLPLTFEQFVLPVIMVGDLSESGLPALRRAASVVVDVAAVAGEIPIMRIEVPPGVVIVVRSIQYMIDGSDTALRVNFGSSLAQNDLLTIHGARFTDLRLVAGPGAVVTSGTTVAGLAAFQARYPIVRATDDPLPLLPDGWIIGTGERRFSFLEFGIETANIRARSTFQWDEYQLF